MVKIKVDVQYLVSTNRMLKRRCFTKEIQQALERYIILAWLLQKLSIHFRNLRSSCPLGYSSEGRQVGWRAAIFGPNAKVSEEVRSSELRISSFSILQKYLEAYIEDNIMDRLPGNRIGDRIMSFLSIRSWFLRKVFRWTRLFSLKKTLRTNNQTREYRTTPRGQGVCKPTTS